jgi:hypothetical protein
MKDGATKEFVQAYNAQAAVDSQAQVIVAAEVTQEANDKKQLVPMVEQVKILTGSPPQHATADSGYFSEANVTDPKLAGIDVLVAPDRQKHSQGWRGPPAPLWKTQRAYLRHPRQPRPCVPNSRRRQGEPFTRCARRWSNPFSDRSRSNEAFEDSCCGGWRT